MITWNVPEPPGWFYWFFEPWEHLDASLMNETDTVMGWKCECGGTEFRFHYDMEAITFYYPNGILRDIKHAKITATPIECMGCGTTDDMFRLDSNGYTTKKPAEIESEAKARREELQEMKKLKAEDDRVMRL